MCDGNCSNSHGESNVRKLGSDIICMGCGEPLGVDAEWKLAQTEYLNMIMEIANRLAPAERAVFLMNVKSITQ